MSDFDVKEKRFEEDIEDFLIHHGGYSKGDPKKFNRESALDEETFVEFIKTSQPKKWDRYVKIYAENSEKQVVERFKREVKTTNLLNVMRHGFMDRGIKFYPIFWKPETSLNETTQIQYDANILHCTRQLHYSVHNENSIDKVYEVMGARMEGNTLLRTNQYKYNGKEIGTMIEKNKIANQSVALKKIRNRNDYLNEGISILDNLANSLDSDMDYLCVMGIEGNAAKVYFPRMFDNVSWNGRKPRIKSDYLNVTLDIGYTMLFNIVDAMLQVYGFDTYYGVFHRCFYMRKSLVCDLMEPMRPIVDYAIRKAINLGQCKMDDFELYGTRWCLKMKNNASYIQFIMAAILDYKDDIFLYIQRYYRFFMKRKSVEQLPTFELH